MTTAIADERSAEFEDKDTDNEDILFGNSVVYPTEKARNLPDEFYMKTVTFEYHPIMAFDKTTEEMAVPMEINVKSALNDIFEGENVPLEGEEKPVKKKRIQSKMKESSVPFFNLPKMSSNPQSTIL